MSVEGEKRKERGKMVGLFEARVIAVNPTGEEYTEVTGFPLKDDSTETEYLGTSKEGNDYLRVKFWLEEVKTKQKFSVSFYLENREREDEHFTKKQYINASGKCSWADDPNNLLEWFKKSDYRVAFVGEEELYKFAEKWLANLDWRTAKVDFEWKKLMKGNVKAIKDEIDGEWSTTVGAMAIINVKEKDGEIKEYQGVYNKGFLYPNSFKFFRLVDYSNEEVQKALRVKKYKELKDHEKFVVDVTSQWGCKDVYLLKDIIPYNPEDFLVASDKVISEGSSDY
jgi:hypothetical protein